MRNLLSRPWRFNELKQNSERIIQKVLTDSLRSMEAVGIITRTVYPEVSPRVEYALSELGESMRPILNAMEVWGRSYKGKLTGQSTCSSHISENAPGTAYCWKQGFVRVHQRCVASSRAIFSMSAS